MKYHRILFLYMVSAFIFCLTAFFTILAMATTEPKELLESNTSTHLPIKLNSSNYPAWYKQIHSLLVARDLVGYVTGDTPCPLATIQSDGKTVPNPAYSKWIRQDKLLYIAFLGSCDPEARSVMASADTSRDALLALQQAFSNWSRSRIMSLKEPLSSISKGTQSVSSYLQSIKSISDELSLIGHPLDDLDLVIYALNGLGPSFREFTASIRTRDSPTLFHELYDKLVDFEMFLEREERLNTSLPVTANHVQRRRQGNTYNRGPNSNNHVANANNKKASVICQYCEKSGHSARTCYKIPGYPNKPRNPYAHVAQATRPSYPPPPPSWLFDSGASHHITNDMENLSIKSDYNGSDNLQVANSKHLPITHIGSAKISTLSSHLKLSNILCVATVTQNLISVSQLCQTNNSIEFFPWHFEVKDLRTGEILLCGLNEDNVYKFTPTSTPHTSLAHTTPTLKLWHQRLGHPAYPTLIHALKTNKISFSESYNKCFDCNKSHKLPFSKSSISSHYPLEILYSDVWGPAPR